MVIDSHPSGTHMLTLVAPETQTRCQTTLALRPYQQDAIAAVEAALAEGIRRPLVFTPTGTGKTVIFSHLIKRRPGRTLVLAHRDDLIEQAATKLRLVDPTVKLGIVKAEQDEVDAPVVLASVQTLCRPTRLARLRADFSTIVVDEAHHATAPSYRRILTHVGSFEPCGPLTLGVTATAERGDGTGLDAVWQAIVFQLELLPMIEQGYLCDLRAIQVQIQVDLDQVHTRAGDFIDSEMEDVLRSAQAPALAAAAYHAYATGGRPSSSRRGSPWRTRPQRPSEPSASPPRPWTGRQTRTPVGRCWPGCIPARRRSCATAGC
jgi:superfamily II DNA or RNA helicase